MYLIVDVVSHGKITPWVIGLGNFNTSLVSRLPLSCFKLALRCHVGQASRSAPHVKIAYGEYLIRNICILGAAKFFWNVTVRFGKLFYVIFTLSNFESGWLCNLQYELTLVSHKVFSFVLNSKCVLHNVKIKLDKKFTKLYKFIPVGCCWCEL